MDDGLRWWREDRVFEAMKATLVSVVEARGNRSKAFAWDVSYEFRRQMEKEAAQPKEGL